MMSDMASFLQLAVTSTLRMSVPIMLAALGASFSMRAGVTAFGSEGMMITGAFYGVYGALLSGNNWVGVLFAVLGGTAISLIHAFLHATHKVNATLSGISVNLIGLGLTQLLVRVIWNSASYSPDIVPFGTLGHTFVAGIPVVGRIFADQYIFFYIAILLVFLGNILMYRTRFGLRLRMVGENPAAAHSIGINTIRYKYIGVMISGGLSGLGGAYLSMAMLSFFQNDMTAGRGFIAMVACNLSNCNPLGSAVASLFFGFFNALQTMFQSVNFPSQILMAMPYAVTLIAAMLNIGKKKRPAGMGGHFDED